MCNGRRTTCNVQRPMCEQLCPKLKNSASRIREPTGNHRATTWKPQGKPPRNHRENHMGYTKNNDWENHCMETTEKYKRKPQGDTTGKVTGKPWGKPPEAIGKNWGRDTKTTGKNTGKRQGTPQGNGKEHHRKIKVPSSQSRKKRKKKENRDSDIRDNKRYLCFTFSATVCTSAPAHFRMD